MVNYSSIFPLSGGGGGSIAGFEWSEKTADFTAEANKAYYCDTALGNILLTLPSNPSPGDEVAFLLIGANKLNFTTTDKIKGAALATDFVKQTSQQYLMVVLFYVDVTTGWNWDSRYDSYIGNGYVGLGDPHVNNVVLFLKGDGANNSTSITDSSLTLRTITRFGDTKISTAQSKYGGSSLYFDGTGDYLSVANSNDFNWFATDYTIEAFIYATTWTGWKNQSNQPTLIGNTNNSGSNYWSFGVVDGIITLFYWSGEVNTRVVTGATVPLNQFNHIALSHKKGTGIYLALNGTVSTVASVSGALFDLATGFQIGASFNATVNGYVDSLRLTKGVARYTASFNPETDTFLN